uniref:Katanin p60 ATPase-containing subunit A1 n=1 Tax=Leptocylindrus danicus TaxID=163516 RepID=A0A7S2NU11_9STRA|mmetsp:Transcript_12023/g.18146  ORF Transcript_12023/g.18146 Transcript_12023/m.18146 type:complete len:474 (+) Transcript_12023:9-1430(+)
MSSVKFQELEEAIELSRDYARLQDYSLAIEEMIRAKGVIQGVLTSKRLKKSSTRRWQSMLKNAEEEIETLKRLEHNHQVELSQLALKESKMNEDAAGIYSKENAQPVREKIRNLDTQNKHPRNIKWKPPSRYDDTQISKSKQRKKGNKIKYSKHAKEKGHPDVELITSIEQDIINDCGDTSWDKIADLDDAKQILQEAVVLPMFMPDFFKGIRRPWRGVLMFGPPGTGKTLLAKAVAAECNTCFFNVSASTLSSKFRGESEKMVRILFEMARFHAPSTIFFDEVDSLAGSRGGPNEHEASRRVKTELMVQMDGIAGNTSTSTKTEYVIVLGATNCPWDLDEAIRRRFEKRIYIPLPSNDGRRKLLQLNLRETEVDAQVNYGELGNITSGYSGADIANVTRDAAMMSVRRVMKRAKEKGLGGNSLLQYIEENSLSLQSAVTQDDLSQAVQKVGKSVSKKDLNKYREWMDEFGST